MVVAAKSRTAPSSELANVAILRLCSTARRHLSICPRASAWAVGETTTARARAWNEPAEPEPSFACSSSPSVEPCFLNSGASSPLVLPDAEPTIVLTVADSPRVGGGSARGGW